MQKDKFSPKFIFYYLNLLKIHYCIGGISLIDFTNYGIINKTNKNKIDIYILEKSIFKLSLFIFFIFLSGFYAKFELSSQNKRIKIRRKFLKNIYSYQDNTKYLLYLTKNLQNGYITIKSGGKLNYFKENDLDKKQFITKSYSSISYSDDKVKIKIPAKSNDFINKYESNLLSAVYKQYNTNFYDPKIVEKGVSLLSGVVNIIEHLKIEYWLEGGTCLGAVRDKHFIPWDHDVDLGIKFDSEKKLNLLINELNAIYKVESRKFSTKHRKQFNGTYRLIKISPNKSIFSKFKEQLLKNIGYKDEFCLDIFIFYKQPLNGDINNIVYKYVVFGKVGYHNRRYLEDTKKIVFYNREYKIPNKVTEWLETKYGPDWKIPREEWHVNLDDKTLNVNQKRFLKN